MPGKTEFAYHEFTTSLASSYGRWDDADFIHHYYFGGGDTVRLLEIGHLREIAEFYAYEVDGTGVFPKLTEQIATEARDRNTGPFTYDFYNTYHFGKIQYSHGGGVVRGKFLGIVENREPMLAIQGRIYFRFKDKFEDPLGLGIEPGGVPYEIHGYWQTRFAAEVLKNGDDSRYRREEN